MEIIIGLVLLYVLQVVLIYGMTFGYFESKYPGMGNEGIATCMAFVASILPLVGPLIIFALSEKVKYGLKYK